MTAHIGIVACSAEGASLCYRTLCKEGSEWLGPHGHAEVSMHTPPLSAYMACIDKDDWPGVAGLLLASEHKLAAAGADFLVCPDNTIHQAMQWVLPASPLSWLHIADVVDEDAKRRGFQTLGLTGTRWLVDSEVYPLALARHNLPDHHATASCRLRRRHIGMHRDCADHQRRERAAAQTGFDPALLARAALRQATHAS